MDDGKATSNVAKHGVTLEEAAHALAGDPEALDLADASDPSRIDTLAMPCWGVSCTWSRSKSGPV